LIETVVLFFLSSLFGVHAMSTSVKTISKSEAKAIEAKHELAEKIETLLDGRMEIVFEDDHFACRLEELTEVGRSSRKYFDFFDVDDGDGEFVDQLVVQLISRARILLDLVQTLSTCDRSKLLNSGTAETN
jgi:hypothetical protein